MKRIEIRHVTRYGFSTQVRLGPHTLLLRPREGHDVRIAASSLRIEPTAVLTWQRDYYENVRATAMFGGATTSELLVESWLEVELYETMPLNFVVEPHALYIPFEYSAEESIALRPFLETVYADHPALDAWLAPYRAAGRRSETYAVLDRLNQHINRELQYEVREQPGVLAPSELLRSGRGSCRDMAALFVESCRRLGVAARFVSGYAHGPGTERGGASSHAWAEVYLPGAGWKGFDPTAASIVGPDHITVAVHRHPEAVPPVAGSFTGPQGGIPTLEVDVQILQLADDAPSPGTQV